MVKFTHNYDKSNDRVFTTVRSVNYMKKHNLLLGSIDTVTFPDKKFLGKLIAYQDLTINNMSLDLLKYDVSPLPCETKEDFVDILNSFLPLGWGHNTIWTTKRLMVWLNLEG